MTVLKCILGVLVFLALCALGIVAVPVALAACGLLLLAAIGAVFVVMGFEALRTIFESVK